jgi:hypothetical protein
VFVINPLIMIAPSIVFAIALVYTVPVVREVRASMISRKTPEPMEEHILEIPGSRFFYVEAASVVGEATGLYVRDYETIREYLVRVKNNLGEAYPIFEEISMLAERELYGGERANEIIVAELLRRLRQQLLK